MVWTQAKRRKYNREYTKARRKVDPEYRQRKRTAEERYQAKCRKAAYDLKIGLSCIRCGESHPACLLFHHKEPSKKRFDISWGMSKGKNMTILKQEMIKCEVLCCNCHAKKHYLDRIVKK